MSVRHASCSCGQLTAACTGEPEKISLCHCLSCQRRTGSTFGIAAFYTTESVVERGTASTYESNADSGSAVTFHFCPVCGSSVLWWPRRKPGIVGVAVGAFADPAFPAPHQAVNTDDRHYWVPESIGNGPDMG